MLIVKIYQMNIHVYEEKYRQDKNAQFSSLVDGTIPYG